MDIFHAIIIALTLQCAAAYLFFYAKYRLALLFTILFALFLVAIPNIVKI